MKHDPIGKFLTDKKMETFWKVITDSHLKKDKSFSFSQPFKNVITALFLHQIQDLDKLKDVYLNHDLPNLEVVQAELKKKEEQT